MAASLLGEFPDRAGERVLGGVQGAGRGLDQGAADGVPELAFEDDGAVVADRDHDDRAALVSRDGLLGTNHHCAFGALQ